jgi:hypothetical protein
MGGSGMKVSLEKLMTQAAATGFRLEVLEKVPHLLEPLDVLRSHPFLKEKLSVQRAMVSC